MRPRSARRRPPAPGSEQHREWLQLVETDGPFLSLPVLKRAWPNGIDRIATEDDRHLRFVDEIGAWQRERAGRHESWIRTVLRELAGWGDDLVTGTEVPSRLTVDVPERGTNVRPWGALFAPGADVERDTPAALVLTTAPGSLPTEPGTDGWAASTVDRLGLLLRRHEVPVGIATDGRWWSLVWGKPGVTTASGTVDASTWREEPLLRDAFLSLVGIRRLLGVKADDRLPALFEASLLQSEEITEALGTQVRRAVELLVQAMSEERLEAQRAGRPDPLPTSDREVYEASVTLLMRVVFLLFAEERGLLPVDRDLYRSAYSLSTYLDVLEARARDGEELLDTTTRGWHRLLAASRAVHDGASFEDVRMPAYGGSLFDGSRFPWLEATSEEGGLRLRVTDRVLLHTLRAVQLVRTDGVPRRVSFREVDVEQIGYIYEGLLGYTCRGTGDDVVLGLGGKEGEEPEVDLASMRAIRDRAKSPGDFADALLAWVEETQPGAKPPSRAKLIRLLESAVDDAEAKRLLRPVCAYDPDVVDAVLPYYPLLRLDLRGLPYVVPAGGLVVVETASRRNAGAHYTPRSLAEEVVEHALEPLVYEPGPLQTADRKRWELKSSAQILDLKVADIAAGSGAFLVAACRYLATRLVEAWDTEATGSGRVPQGEDSRERLALRARREVIAHCLYGADINEMAVEMCKLSLWLVSLDPTKPFSFVDDKVLLGNSLLGLTREDQLRGLHISPSYERLQNPGFTLDVEAPLKEAEQLRLDIASSPVDDGDPQRSATHKAAMLARAREVTDALRRVADSVIAAGLTTGGRPGRQLDAVYEDLALALLHANQQYGPRTTHLDSILNGGLTPGVDTDYERWVPLHWMLEVPEIARRGGFDAIVGNPPFLGGSKISGAFGTNFREWLMHVIAKGKRGNADLAAYFLLRAGELITTSGQLGLIATNTIAQGDTRDVGLQQLMSSGVTVRRSIQSATWPSASANLEYAAVWASALPPAADAQAVSDGLVVLRISSLLEPEGRTSGHPERLNENRSIAYSGAKLDAKGFVLTPRRAAELIASDARNRDVVFPFINGEDLNSRPDLSPSRFVINFHDWSESRARAYPEPFAIVEKLVKPERRKNNRKQYRDLWWRYAERRPGLVARLANFSSVLAIAITSKTVMPVRVPTGAVFSHAINIFVTDDDGDLCTLSTSFHQTWAIKYGSGLRTDPRYAASDVFETFPRPPSTAEMGRLGRELSQVRQEVMDRRDLGLTTLYSRMNDPAIRMDSDVERMRGLHVAVDTAALSAYGWEDLPLDHGFHTYRQARRFTISPRARIEVLDRLLEENHRRAATERREAAMTTVSGRRRSSAPMQEERLL